MDAGPHHRCHLAPLQQRLNQQRLCDKSAAFSGNEFVAAVGFRMPKEESCLRPSGPLERPLWCSMRERLRGIVRHDADKNCFLAFHQAAR
mmetsp:Transcript_40912/g.80733  ORF Transcript_40912/g.80733 Transcript_40912/m.80733 type:complete len:90 (+) Transcript_40912:739-1008(+)